MQSKNIKVLFIYPNNIGYTRIPPGISVLIGVLKNKGYCVKVFDTSFYKLFKETDDDIRAKTHQVRYVDLTKYGVKYQEATFQDIISNCAETIEIFNPGLIAFSVVTEDCAEFSLQLAEEVKKRFKHIPILCGGIAVTMAPEDFIHNEAIDIINIGEGEDSLLELVTKMSQSEDITSIRNMWFKQNDRIIKNEVRPLKNLDELPYPNFEEFDGRHFYRPVDGIVYRMAMIEFTRGCPRQCSYCNNHVLQVLYRNKGKYIRRKNIDRVMEEMVYLKKKYNLSLRAN